MFPRTKLGFIIIFCTLTFQIILNEAEEDIVKSTKVVGGRVALKNEFPYIVAISRDFGVRQGVVQYCGGAIYNNKFIITAAHCFVEDNDQPTDPKKAKIIITAGEHNLIQNDGTEQTATVVKVINHPEFSQIFENDISILELNKPLVYNKAVQPIPIAPKNYNSSGKAVLAGWGLTQVRKSHSRIDPRHRTDVLQTVTIVVVPKDECDHIYENVPRSSIFADQRKGTGLSAPPDSVLCAGEMPDGGKDSCQGDSGGPLSCSRKTENGKVEKYLCGVVSSGFGCGLQVPGSYTDVSKYYDWINAVTKS